MALGLELVAVACPSVGTNAMLPRMIRSCIVLPSPDSLAGKVTRFSGGYNLSIWAFFRTNRTLSRLQNQHELMSRIVTVAAPATGA